MERTIFIVMVWVGMFIYGYVFLSANFIRAEQRKIQAVKDYAMQLAEETCQDKGLHLLITKDKKALCVG